MLVSCLSTETWFVSYKLPTKISRSTVKIRTSKSPTIRKLHCYPVYLTLSLNIAGSPYVKGLPITVTIMSTLPNGDHLEEIIRREQAGSCVL